MLFHHRAVMRHMHIGHEQVVVAYAGDAAAGFRAAVQRGEFPDIVPVADDEAAHLAMEFQILRFSAHGGIGIDMVVLPHGGVPLDGGEGIDARTRADDHIIFNDGAGGRRSRRRRAEP